VPIGDISERKSPNNTYCGQSPLEMAVFGNMFVVIQVDELMIAHLPESSQGYHNKNQAYEEFTPHEGISNAHLETIWMR
jgi:hypothetical protein